jgi:hypothetical protein
MIMCHWTEELLERTEDYLLQAQIEHACVVDCIWDSDAEYVALCNCYNRYDPNLFTAVDHAGVLHVLGTFQVLTFASFEASLVFCKETPVGMPHIAVWEDFTFVTDNSGDETC